MRLAIVGCVGIPNRYGGFESFAENISVALQRIGLQVVVTCERMRYEDDQASHFSGVRRLFIDLPANGAMSPLHDLLAFFRVFRHVDSVLVLGISAGIFFPLLRLCASLLGRRLLVNVDGVEWRRSKFGRWKRRFLYISDRIAQRFAHTVIYDNAALAPYLFYPEKSHCIAYSGEHALVAAGNAPAGSEFDGINSSYALTICRIEPENNCGLLIDGFLASGLSSYIFVGNWAVSAYGRELRHRHAGNSRLQLLDPIYDPVRVYALRNGCSHYLHGHAVGGTNPSLVEMIFFKCGILCFDCDFNRSTASGAAIYFRDSGELAAQLKRPLSEYIGRAPEVRERYQLQTIVKQLLGVLYQT